VARIRDLLRQVADKLGLNRKLLARAQRRYKANRRRAFVAHNEQGKAQRAADHHRRIGTPARLRLAEKEDKNALRLSHVAYKNHQRAQYWLGVVKKLTQRVEGLETTQAELEAERQKLSKVTIEGNAASGGTRRQRLRAVALSSAAACASGKRPNFYSQPGSWDVDHCITGERYGERSDCSSWVTSVYKSAGLADPNGANFTGGYTGTQVANGTQIDHADLKPGDLVIYGSGAGHHVEMFVGPGEKTIGHGSAPVDAGVVNLFGDGDCRCFRYFR
jgi:cell wall-associated NlpC family hydrolase